MREEDEIGTELRKRVEMRRMEEHVRKRKMTEARGKEKEVEGG